MAILNSRVVKIKNSRKSLIISNVDHLTDDDCDFFKKNLVEISQGRESGYTVQVIAKKLQNFLERQSNNTMMGATAEFFLVCIMRNSGFSQEYCYRNLEENSIKKGFDGLFSREGKLWLAESKSTEDHIKHKHTIDLAYDSLLSQISGKTSNDPWENAVSHAIQARSQNSLIKKLVYLSEQYTKGNYETIEQQNIIIGSTVISESISKIDSTEGSLEECLAMHEAADEILVAINLKDKELFKNFVAEVAANE